MKFSVQLCHVYNLHSENVVSSVISSLVFKYY